MITVDPGTLAWAGITLMVLGWLTGWIMRGYRERS